MGRIVWIGVLLLLPAASAQTQGVVVSQIYGGGGNAGATLKNDYVELFNRTASPVSVEGWRMEYASATGDFNQSTALTGTIPANGYYLIGQAQGTGGTDNLPAPEVQGSIAMSATSARVRIQRADSSVVELVSYAGLSNTTAYFRGGAGCGDSFLTGVPTPRNSGSPLKICEAAPTAAQELTISQIQGSGDASPYANTAVTTTGMVTQRRGNGFYFESEASADDGDPSTSEGIFVYTVSAPPALAAVNKVVRVSGTVTEFNGMTEITEPSVEALRDGTPRRVVIVPGGLEPGAPVSTWERYEGMQRGIDGLRVVAPSGGSINDATATATTNGVLWAIPRELPLPQAEPAPADGNPERIRIDSELGIIRAVDAFATVSGGLDFTGGAWSITAKTLLAFFQPDPAPPVLEPVASELTIASFNLRRFFDDRDDPGVADPVLTAAAFQRRLTKTALHITGLLRSPDLIAVQEADTLYALQQLAAKLGGSWRAYLEEGNDPSGIDVGFLVNTARVTVQSVTQLEKSNPVHDRPPLLLRATVQGLPIAVLTVHQRSLINAGDAQVREKRQAQASAVAQIAAGLRNENTVVLGDFNAHAFDDGNGNMLQPLLDAGYSRLGAMLPAAQSFTYIENGQIQELDHIFVSSGLNARLSRYEVAHTNAAYPVIDFNSTEDPQRASDHDIPVARFRLETTPPPVRGVGLVNAATLLGGAVSPFELATLFGSGFTSRTSVLFGNASTPPAPANVFFTSPGQINFSIPNLPAGPTTVQVLNGSSALATFELRTATAAPGLFTQNGSGQGAAAALNQDYSLNTAASPAAAGTVLQLYGTGISRQGVTSVLIGGRTAQVFYAGQAPGLIEGAVQINALVPPGLPGGPAEVLVTSDGATSRRGVQVWVR